MIAIEFSSSGDAIRLICFGRTDILRTETQAFRVVARYTEWVSRRTVLVLQALQKRAR